ncbi:hypothetical protein, partial [Lactococcus petauri]|uniref:hypothetical protein n=1 Tax=Lactococcus petauri TaxID=1940789 RepID=UPI0021F1CD53
KGNDRYLLSGFGIAYEPVEDRLRQYIGTTEAFFHNNYHKFYKVSNSGVKGGGENIINFNYNKKSPGCFGKSEKVWGKRWSGTNSIINLYLPLL